MSSEKKYTTSGIELPVTLTGDEATSEDRQGRCGAGEYPYTRGVYPDMYRGRMWTMRQYAGFGTAAETNRRFKYLLEKGQTGLSVAFDLATQIGYDSDHSMARGEVGRTGVAIDSLADMELLFDGIPLDKVSTSMTINSTAVILLAMYIAVGRKQGVARDKLMGTIQNDILKEFIARGTYIFPPAPSMRIITDIFAYAGEHLPRYNTISISGYHIREAGSTAAQEVAFTLADAIAYCEAAIKAGLKIDDFAPRLSFFFAAHNDLLEEVAKFRAARKIWATIVKEHFGATNPKALLLRFHAQTGGSTLTAQQPENNIVRTAIEALAAVLGGTQSLHTNAFDEALALPTEKSAEIALRTQQVIAYESGVTNTVDPLAGSYAVEYLTSQLEERIRSLMDKIVDRGGSVRCIESGWFQTEIARSAYEHQRHIEAGETVIVGVNRFQSEQADIPQILKVDAALEAAQIASLSRLKSGRDQARVDSHLESIRRAARGPDNLVPPIISAVEDYVTVGEISDVLRAEWGEFREGT
ncbi:MAG: methylmalonyl-CoA mutase family protein [bacterium]